MNKEYAKYLLEKTTEDYNLIARQFSSTRRFIWRGLESLSQYVLPREKVLDLGCGNGRLLQIFKDIDIDYIGVDSSEKLIEIARRIYPGTRFQVANAINLAFPNNCFDKVYSVAVLHHIPSKELRLQFLRGVLRVLKPGGLLVLTVWDLGNLRGWKLNLKFGILKILGKSKLDFNDVFVPWGKTCQRYIHCFTKRELKKLAAGAGFKVKEVGILKMPEAKENNIYLVAEK